MEKIKIQREMLKHNYMQQIVFRIDYHGIIDARDISKEFTGKFSNLFNELKTAH